MRRSFIRLLTDDSAGGTCGFVLRCKLDSWIPGNFSDVALPNNTKVAVPELRDFPDCDGSIKEVGAI